METKRQRLAAAVVALCALAAALPASAKTAYDFAFTSIEGDPLPMERFRGRAVLLVNTASFCGFTPQYAALQALWERYRDRGLVVLGVPSNDFGGQEPNDEAEIKRFCEVNYQVDFPLTAKQVVKGGAAHPLYRWIVESLGDDAAPRWNFHKYLIGKDGDIAGGWPSQVAPLSDAIVVAIEKELEE